MSKFCPNCGGKIIEGTKFCSGCGANLAQVFPPPPQYQPELQPSPVTVVGDQKPKQQYLGAPTPAPDPMYDSQATPTKKKMRKWNETGMGLVFTGLIIIIIFAVLYMPTDIKTASELEKDFDSSTEDFRSYNSGDHVNVEGKIESETKDPSDFAIGGYEYRYDLVGTSFALYSEEDIGDEGDSVALYCDVISVPYIGGGSERREALLYGSDISSRSCCFGAGLIVSVIFFIVGIFKIVRGSPPISPVPQPK